MLLHHRLVAPAGARARSRASDPGRPSACSRRRRAMSRIVNRVHVRRLRTQAQRPETQRLLGADDAVDVLAFDPSSRRGVGGTLTRSSLPRAASGLTWHARGLVSCAPRRTALSPARAVAFDVFAAFLMMTWPLCGRGSVQDVLRFGPCEALAILAPRRCGLEQALDLGDERVGQTGLRDERVAAGLARPFRMPRQRVAGQRHDRNVARRGRRPSAGASPPSRPSAAAPDPSARCRAAARASSRSPRRRCRPRTSKPENCRYAAYISRASW